MQKPINQKPCDKLWALLSVDKNGNEGICAINTPIGPQVAISGEEKLLKFFLQEIQKPQAKQEVVKAKMKIVIAEFIRSKTTEIG